MVYKWDNDLLKQANLNLRMQNDFTHLKSEQENLFNLTGGYFSPMRSKLVKDFEYLSHLAFYRSYLYNIIHDYGYITYRKRPYKVDLSEDDILALTYDFYRWLDVNLFHDFEKIFAERSTHLKFLASAKENIGQTIYYNNSNETFISIYNSNNLGSVFTAIHEYAHAIWYKRVTESNPRMKGRDTYRELESIFMEMIAIDYFSKFPEFKKDTKAEQAALLNSFIMEINIMYRKFIIFNKYMALRKGANGAVNYHILLKQIEEDLPMTKKDIKKTFKIPAENIIPYSLGALVAFELYHIYQSDPEKALWFYKIILSKNLKTEEEMNYAIKKMGINPSTHIDTFTRKLTKH